MTKELTQAETYDLVGGSKNQAGSLKKKKASWLHTVLWMLSMILLANGVMAIIAYFLFFHNK